jgi:undecaprenyl-diphosphatase
MLFRLDDYLFHLLYAGGRGPLTTAAMVLSALGGGWAILAIVPLAFRPGTRRFAVWLVGTLAATAAVVFVLKGVIGRGRPCTVYGGLGVTLLGSPTDCSLPSGHAAGSFAFAFFVMEVLRVRPRSRYAVAASTALIVFASGVALSRVVLGFHFPLDVVAGATLGAAMGMVAGRQFHRGAEALRRSLREETRPHV